MFYTNVKIILKIYKFLTRKKIVFSSNSLCEINTEIFILHFLIIFDVKKYTRYGINDVTLHEKMT